MAVVLVAFAYLLVEAIIYSRKRKAESPLDREGRDRDWQELQARVVALERRFGELEVKLGVAEPVETDDPLAAYDYAVQYARQGMIAPEIAARCGISRDEAALIVTMHRKSLES